jgi:hypothetical protein
MLAYNDQKFDALRASINGEDAEVAKMQHIIDLLTKTDDRLVDVPIERALMVADTQTAHPDA